MFRNHFHYLHLFQTLIPFFGHWGYLIIILASFLEGLPILGYISPGGISVILGGVLVRGGVLEFWPVIIFAIVGAYLGDFLAYIIGKIYGQHLLSRYGKYFFLKEEHIDKSRQLLKTHQAKALIIGRFSYLTRSLAPFLAGLSEISIWKFAGLEAISVLLWSFSHVFLGIIFSQSYQTASHYINLVFLSAIIFSIIIFYGYRFVNKKQHLFQKYHIYALALNILSIYVFAKALEDVLAHEWFYRVDFVVNHFISTLWNPVMIEIMIVITNFLNPVSVFFLTCLFIGYLLSRREYYYSLLSFLALAFGTVAQYFLKLITGVPRPLEPLLGVSNFSFPSGHATFITIFGILLFHCLRRDLKKDSHRMLLLVGVIVLILLVGFSRLYLNVHWLSDIIGGYALGLFAVTFFILFLRAGSFFGKQVLKMTKSIIWPLISPKQS